MSADGQQNVHFKQLNASEKKSKLSLLVKSSSRKLLIWEKGSKSKTTCIPTDYLDNKDQIFIKEMLSEDVLEKEHLFSFEIHGLHFFGKCIPKRFGKQQFYIEVDEEIFKSERRSNFRLLTYPHQEVYVSIFIGKEKIEESNLVNINTRLSQTGLFKNFLDLVDGEEESSVTLEGYLEFRVLDISVTGLAFQYGEIESSFFPSFPMDIGKIYVRFNDETIVVDKAKLLYRLDMVAANQKSKLYKAGVEFQDIDINLDEKLSKIINKTLRSLEAEFEDFLK